MTNLEPPADDLADVLIRMTELDWPTSEEERLRFFERLGFDEVENPRPDDSDLETERCHFSTALPGAVDGTATMFRREFLGLSLFAYNEPGAGGSLASAGYAGLHDLLSQRLGPPVEEWGTTIEPACLWRPGPLLLDMYCFQRHQSGIMVGPSHAARSAALDSAAAGLGG